MSLVAFALRRPYTILAAVVLVCLLGMGAALRMPVDIFPEIDIPVVSVVWTYSGMNAQDVQNRILTIHQRELASLVDDISHIEATAYDGVGVERVYLHEGADVNRAISQVASSALAQLKRMPRNIMPPLVLRYGATDVPIIQLSLSSDRLPDSTLNDLGQHIIRPDLAVVHGADVPYPYGGKPRVIMVDLDQQALQSRGMSPSDVSMALQHQNVILPAGDVKIGPQDYTLTMNSSPDIIEEIDAFPIKKVGGRMVLLGDVAHVHDGFQVQTNSVSVNGMPGALMTIRKTGGVSTLAVIDGILKTLPDIAKVLPKSVSIKPIFDQSLFVKAALNSVLMGGAMAAGLTATMILLFLGNWRLTLIIIASIPLSIIAAVLAMYLGKQTLNTMTLGGFALAVGILVDNATVVIENIDRHLHSGSPLETAIIGGAGEVGLPTFLSTLCICIVFVPVFLLEGTAKYLFSPLSLSVCISLAASLALSFTLVPVMFKYLMRSVGAHGQTDPLSATPGRRRFFGIIHERFNHAFESFRHAYSNILMWTLSRPAKTVVFSIGLMAFSLLLFPRLGQDFFPEVDAGQMRLHVRAPAGTRIEQTKEIFTKVSDTIREIVGNDQIDVILDNIGLPYSGINIALSDSATVGPMDGEILISLKPKHTPTVDLMAKLRQELPERFAGVEFFFQPSDIINQVLNFGQPSPIDIRVSGPRDKEAYQVASKLARDIKLVPGLVDSHVFQVLDAPSLSIAIDRRMATEFGIDQENIVSNILVATNSSAQTMPNFWVNPHTGISYQLVVQMPTYRINSTQDLWRMPVAVGNSNSHGQLLANISKFSRSTVPMALSQHDIRPVFDVHANVQERDLYSVAKDLDKVIAMDTPEPSRAISVVLAGQVETMRESYSGLFGGMALAVLLVYLFLVMMMNFQNLIDPLIVLIAVPFAIGGVMWMLSLSQTHLSVPALMGTLMCIGLTTANSILMVTFANQRMQAGDEAWAAALTAGFTRLRPVLMTAGAMILGMIPMALGVGEGGEQNAPLARAVIGGLLFATFATLIFVPTVYYLLRRVKISSPNR